MYVQCLLVHVQCPSLNPSKVGSLPSPIIMGAPSLIKHELYVCLHLNVRQCSVEEALHLLSYLLHLQLTQSVV